VTSLMNQMFYNVITNMYNSINAIALAGGIAAYIENAGITAASVNDVIRLIRRWGAVTLMGDYSSIVQLNTMAGFQQNAVPTVQFSEAVMEEIRRTGLLSSINGATIAEIPNVYNTTRINQTAGINNQPYFETLLPEGLLFAMPRTNFTSPLQVGVKGGVTSLEGVDLATATKITRYDIEFGKLNIAA